MKSKPRASIYLDKRNALKDGRYPVTLMILFERKGRFYRIRGKDGNIPGFTVDEYKKIFDNRTSNINKEYRKIFQTVEDEAKRIIESMDYFSFDLFKEAFFKTNSNTNLKNNVFDYLDSLIEKTKANKKFSTASTYSSTKGHLEKFNKKKNLLFQELSPSYLIKFETWMKDKQGVGSINTIGIYMRNLRILYNQAIRDDVAKYEHYPFGKGKYQIPKLTKKTLKALTKEEVHLINDYQTVDRTKQWVRDIWIFSYLSNGMNIADIAHIENKDVTKAGFEFVRKKTKETAKSNLKSISVAMQLRMKEIIEMWGNPPEKKYLFPIIDESMNVQTMDLKVRNLNNLITKKIKHIAKECKIEKDVTAVYARHSFATVLRNSGASIEYISEALGHNNVTTTMHYLAKFDTGIVKKWSNELL